MISRLARKLKKHVRLPRRSAFHLERSALARPVTVQCFSLLARAPLRAQVESDIAPYKGLLMGLFFMSVGMEISGQLFLAKVRRALRLLV